MLLLCVLPSVRVPQAGIVSKLLARSLVLAWMFPSTYPTLLLKKLIHVCTEINVFSSGTLSQTLDFTTFATARRSSQRVVNLTRQWRTIVVINWTVVVQVNNACDVRRLVDRPPLSTARFHRAGPSATAVERGLVVGFCGQPHYCYRPYYPTARFPSPSSYVVSDEPFPGRSRPM